MAGDLEDALEGLAVVEGAVAILSDRGEEDLDNADVREVEGDGEEEVRQRGIVLLDQGQLVLSSFRLQEGIMELTVAFALRSKIFSSSAATAVGARLRSLSTRAQRR